MVKHKISIENRIRFVFVRMMLFLIVSIVINMISSYVFSLQYNQIITNIEYANLLKDKVEREIYQDSWNIVSGMTTFDSGEQFNHINQIYEGISYLVEHTTLGEGSTQLEVAKRTTNTLESYLVKLGESIRASAKVDDTLAIHEEIRSVSLLVGEVLQEFVYFEINNAARLNNIMQNTQTVILGIDIIAIVGFILMVFATIRSLTGSIKHPLSELESMAGKIAQGDFSIQVENTGVMELESLTSSLNIMARRIESLIKEINDEHENLKKAELSLLQAQIKPHFLYNTYDTIIWLAEKKHLEDVILVVEALTSFYRVALSKGNEWISVVNEIKHVESYLIIQHFRYGNILDYSIDVPEALHSIKVLKLLLQPLVENSLYHGIKYLRGKGTIRIKAYSEEECICFVVEDTGIGMDAQTLEKLKKHVFESSTEELAEEKSGFGLRNVNHRIKLYYGSRSSMTIESVKEVGTTITLKLPIGGHRVDN
jgi:two-component system, sensor histidine kinase YesM